MNEDPRCCGSGTCIIDAEGRCWCGQLWDGQTMCRPPLKQAASCEEPATAQSALAPSVSTSADGSHRVP